jgi:SAM-dependent methyltransferase
VNEQQQYNAVRRVLRPSGFLLDVATRIRPVGLVLDAPSGFGRNARFLSQRGLGVVCLDRSIEALRSLGDQRYRLWLPPGKAGKLAMCGGGRLHAVCGDMLRKRLPFASRSFGFVVNVHFTVPEMISEFGRVTKPGGYLVVETIGAHGGNAEQLPAPGELRARLEAGFTVERYAEKAVRSRGRAAVTVKLLARRRGRHSDRGSTSDL